MKAAIICVIALVAIATTFLRPYTLWVVVHDLCSRDAATFGSPFPCVRVEPAAGYAIVKAPMSRTHFLLVPTDRLRGIEDPRLVKVDAPNYWRDAWSARALIETTLHRAMPRDFIGMAINSKHGRTQNQLHIHIDCIQPDVLEALEKHNSQIGAAWTDLSFHLRHQSYRARRVYSGDLNAVNPFLSLFRGDSVARADMADETLAVIGLRQPGGQDGFVMLSRHATALNGYRGYSEDLLDHGCRLADLFSRGR